MLTLGCIVFGAIGALTVRWWWRGVRQRAAEREDDSIVAFPLKTDPRTRAAREQAERQRRSKL